LNDFDAAVQFGADEYEVQSVGFRTALFVKLIVSQQILVAAIAFT
jgi:hypothetical protein